MTIRSVPNSLTPLVRRPSFWLGLVVTGISVVVLLAVVNLNDLVNVLRQANVGLVALSGVLIVAAIFVRGWRWQIVLRTPTPFWTVFHVENVGYLINNILPLRLGEPARAVMLSRVTPMSPLEILSTIVVTRLADMIAVLGMLGLVIPALGATEGVRLAGYGTLLTALALTLLTILGIVADKPLLRITGALSRRILPAPLATKIIGWLAELLIGLTPLRQPRKLIGLVGSTVLIWLCYLLYYHVTLMALTPHPPIAWATLATCTASLSTAIPASPAYVGVYDAVVAFTVAPYIGQTAAIGYAIILHGVEFIIVLLFGLVSLAASGAALGKVALGAAALSESPNPLSEAKELS